MNIEDALSIIDSILPGRSLNNIQELLFRQTWEGKTYLAIAENSGYDASYVRDVGYKLWQTLSKAFDERVTKKNLQVVLRRYAAKLAANSPQANPYGAQHPYESSTHPSMRNDPGLGTRIGNMPGSLSNLNPQTLPQQNWPDFTSHSQLNRNFIPAGSRNYEQLAPEAIANQPQDQNLASPNQLPHQPLNPHPFTSANQTRQQDWGSAIDTSDFGGRELELAQLQQWLLIDHTRLIGILGFGGVGKTALAAKIADRCEGKFDYLIWRSLRNAPALVEILRDLVTFLGQKLPTTLPTSAPAQTDRLILLLLDCLRQQRCLLILDQVEAIMRPGDRNGFYLPGYEGYGDLFQQIGAIRHQSCLLLTSREKPYGLMPASQDDRLMALTQLGGLGLAAAAQLPVLAKLSQSNPPEAIANLASHYQGNPKLIKAAGRSIQELFDGSIEQFLAQDATVFGEIRHLLKQQYDRLSELEQRVMFWLAILPTPTTVMQLAQLLWPITTQAELLEAITSLRWRSLITKQDQGFGQLPIVRKYITNLVIEAADEAITQSDPEFLVRFALYLPDPAKPPATGDDHAAIATEPESAVLLACFKPLIAKLIAHFGTKRNLGNRLSQMLCQLGQPEQLNSQPQHLGYVKENLIILLRQLQLDCPGNDFSHLPIWQAYLQAGLNERIIIVNPGAKLEPGSHTSEAIGWGEPDDLYAFGDLSDLKDLSQLSNITELAASSRSHWGQSETTTTAIAITFSPDGKLLACSNSDGTIKLRNSTSGECIATLNGHSQIVFATTFSPDGQILASGSYDQTIRLWDIQTGECLKTLQISAGNPGTGDRQLSNLKPEPKDQKIPAKSNQAQSSVIPKGTVKEMHQPATRLLDKLDF
jgi:hypothetical protein